MFEKTDDLRSVYDIIEKNRAYKGFPLRMEESDIEKTATVIDVDLFLVKNNRGVVISSAIIFRITKIYCA